MHVEMTIDIAEKFNAVTKLRGDFSPFNQE